MCLLLAYLLYDRISKGSQIDERIDDLAQGIGMMANELLARTEKLMEIKDFMPEISLVNQNPLASLGEFIRAMRGEPANTISPATPAFGPGVNYAASEEEKQDTTPDLVDVID